LPVISDRQRRTVQRKQEIGRVDREPGQ
jgi:hypothetical protein